MCVIDLLHDSDERVKLTAENKTVTENTKKNNETYRRKKPSSFSSLFPFLLFHLSPYLFLVVIVAPLGYWLRSEGADVAEVVCVGSEWLLDRSRSCYFFCYTSSSCIIIIFFFFLRTRTWISQAIQ